MMNKEIKFEWNDVLNLATCIVKYKDMEFKGVAKCHPDDVDFVTDKVGYNIAFTRASIKVLQHRKNNELKPALDALNQLYYSMNRSKHYDKKHYESRMLTRQIKQKENDIEVINQMIQTQKEELRIFIQEKDDFYNKVRKNRGSKNGAT